MAFSFSKQFTRLALVIAFAYIGLFLFAWFIGRQLVFPMPASSYKEIGADWINIPYNFPVGNTEQGNADATNSTATVQGNADASRAANAADSDGVAHHATAKDVTGNADAAAKNATGAATGKSAAGADASHSANPAGSVTGANAATGVNRSEGEPDPAATWESSTVVARILEAENPQGYILYQHGNNEDLGTIANRLRTLRDLGWTVLAWDYPGYGQSPGESNEAIVSTAMRAVAAYARDTLKWPVAETVIYGRSVGGGPSILLATEDSYKGLILEGTFTSAFRIATFLKVLPFDVFDNWARIGSIRTPVLFLHGTRDEVVPFSHGPRLYASAPEPKQHRWFEAGKHNNLPEDFREPYLEAVGTFLKALPTPQPETE